MLLLLCTLFILSRSAVDDNACLDDDTTLIQIAQLKLLNWTVHGVADRGFAALLIPQQALQTVV